MSTTRRITSSDELKYRNGLLGRLLTPSVYPLPLSFDGALPSAE